MTRLSSYRDGRLQLEDEIVNVNGRRLRNLSMAQASAVLRLPVPVVEMVICRGGVRRGERAKRHSVDDLLQENSSTIILVNGESVPPVPRRTVEPPCYENIDLPLDGESALDCGASPSPSPSMLPQQHLDDSGVEISESGSCSSGSHLEADLLLELPKKASAGRQHGKIGKSMTSSDEAKIDGASSSGDSSSAAPCSPSKQKASDFCTLPRRPKLQVSHSFYTIVYEKGPGKKSLGFTLVGGIDSPKGPMSFFVKTYVSSSFHNKAATFMVLTSFIPFKKAPTRITNTSLFHCFPLQNFPERSSCRRRSSRRR